ncbi:MmpS family transport accessory protein [Amycolatopsis sp. NBC_00438]|uniref:MmpS family transport accessory protein n=1 Tax=Amycolatopsis sp. NBC_00438 TaxID=2903558 RepID=UPI002E21933C
MGVPIVTPSASPAPPVPLAGRDRGRCRPTGNVVVVLGVLVLAFVVTSYVVPRSARGPVKDEPVAAPVVPAAVSTVTHSVVYELLGAGGARNVTYSAAGSALVQEAEVATPWSATFTRVGPADRTEFYSIAAQNPGPGELRCRIVVDGVVLSEKATSEPGRQFSCAV